MGDLHSPRSCPSDLAGANAVATNLCKSTMPKMPGFSLGKSDTGSYVKVCDVGAG